MSRANQFLVPTMRANVIAPVSFTVTGEEGDTDTTTIEITFSGGVVASLYDAGVTIKINSVATTIISATRQSDHAVVYFVVADAVDINDVVTFEYDDDFGDYASESTTGALTDIAASGTTNYVGSHLWFNTGEDSGHLAYL